MAFTWLLDKVTDNKGNYMTISYFEDNNTGEFRPQEIDYTGTSSFVPYNQVKFNYGTRTDIQAGYQAAGNKVMQSVLLTSVVTYAQNTYAHEYDFNYSQNPVYGSQLSEVVEKGTDGSQYNSTKIVWGQDAGLSPQGFSPINTGGTYNNASITYSGDFNGDGYGDLLTLNIIENQLDLSINDQHAGVVHYTLPVLAGVVNALTLGGNHNQTIDLDGDGKSDILFYTTIVQNGITVDQFMPWISKIPSTFPLPTPSDVSNNFPNLFTSGQSFIGENSSASHAITGDFDGDGATDLFVYYDKDNGNGDWYFESFKNPLNSINGNQADGPNVGSAATFTTIDINGDGKNEIMWTLNQSGTGNYFVANVDFGVNRGNLDIISSGISTINGTSLNGCENQRIWTGDFNGDGRTDLLAYNSCQMGWNIYYAKASSTPDPGGYFETQFQKFPAPISLYTGSSSGSSDPLNISADIEYFVGDFNGDGKDDIATIDHKFIPDQSIPYIHGYCTGTVYYSLGNNSFATPIPFNYYNRYLPNTGMVIDFFGTGRSCIMYSDAFQSPNGVYGESGIDFLSVPLGNPTNNINIYRPLPEDNLNKVSSIINGLNSTISINYKTLPELTASSPIAYKKGTSAQFPVADFQRAFSVVANTEADNSTGTQNETDYSYEGAQTHLQGKGFLGFTSVSSTNEATNISNISTYSLPDNSHFFQRTLLTQTIKTSLASSSPNTIISTKTFAYTEPFITGSILPLSVDPSGLRYYFYANSITDNDALHGKTTVTTISQDNNGNTTSQSSTTIPSAVTSTTTNSNFSSIGSWIPYFFNNTSTITTRTSSGVPFTTSAQIVPDPHTGQPTKITVFGNDGTMGDFAVTDLTYDAFGNLLSTSVGGTNIATPHTSSNAYDQPYHRFVITQTNPIGSLHATYDNAYGNVISKTDLNNLTTSYTYNGFGSLITTTTPTAPPINVKLSFDNSVQIGNNTSLFSVTTTQQSSPTSTQYFDELGRSLRSQTAGFLSTDIIKADKEYNSIGQLIKQYEPYKTAQDKFTFYSTFDAFLRPKNITSASGATSTFTYTGNSTTVQTVTGNGTKTSTKVLDASGALTSSTENGETIAYSYHSCGKPSMITPPASSSVTMDYDAFGRQKQLIDPDAGAMNYLYDVLGELTQQTDAKGNIYTIAYDALGRIKSKTGNDNSVVTYTYDDVNGKGKIDKIIGSNDAVYHGITCDYDYDSKSRIIKKTENLGADGSYTTQYAYDPVTGKVIQETYPGSSNPFTISMSYNNNGYLQAINDPNHNPIWTCTSMNQFLQVTGANQGNNGTVSKTYSDLGFLTNITATEVSPGTAMNVYYTFDPTTGNLTNRVDFNNNFQSESFSYDSPRDRLTDIYLNGSVNPTNSTSYNSGGNIGSKTDVGGTYNYAGAQPHAVSAIENPSSNIPTVQQTITYTPFNKADKIFLDPNSSTPYSLQFSYGPQQTRKKSVLTNTQLGTTPRTVIYDGDYEKITVPNHVYEVHYINSPDGLVAIFVKDNGAPDQIYYVHTDHLGSIMSLYDETGTKVYEQSFDAWGNKRDPADWASAPNPAFPAPDWLIRGYTGHEHHQEFGLINMNGRMYDPLLGRMLSPDNNVQAPESSDGYNRYSYCFNNPLKFTDPTGMTSSINGGGDDGDTHHGGSGGSDNGFMGMNWQSDHGGGDGGANYFGGFQEASGAANGNFGGAFGTGPTSFYYNGIGWGKSLSTAEARYDAWVDAGMQVKDNSGGHRENTTWAFEDTFVGNETGNIYHSDVTGAVVLAVWVPDAMGAALPTAGSYSGGNNATPFTNIDISSPDFPGVKILEDGGYFDRGYTLNGVIHVPQNYGLANIQHEYGHFLQENLYSNLGMANIDIQSALNAFVNTLGGVFGLSDTHMSYWTETEANKLAVDWFGPKSDIGKDPYRFPTH